MLFVFLLVLLASVAERLPAPTTKDLIDQRILFPVAEAARLLGKHRTSLYDLARAGRLQLVRDGARTYVHRDELARYIAEEVKPVQLESRKKDGPPKRLRRAATQ